MTKSLFSGQVLGSKWTGLSPHLLATVFAVDQRGQAIPNQPGVVGPITDGNVEITANWQSPFEQAGVESKAPAIMSLVQSGAAETLVSLFGKAGSGDQPGLLSRLAAEITDFAREGAGRSGMTKLSSTQVFTGASPIKVPVTMHFRAFSDPATEVQAPVDQLVRWALARELARNGSLVSAIQAFRDGQGFLKALLPSQSPQMVGLLYGGYTLAPMVVESISHPITVPRASYGAMVHVAVTMTLASLTALDANDWRRARSGQPIQRFNN